MVFVLVADTAVEAEPELLESAAPIGNVSVKAKFVSVPLSTVIAWM